MKRTVRCEAGEVRRGGRAKWCSFNRRVLATEDPACLIKRSATRFRRWCSASLPLACWQLARVQTCRAGSSVLSYYPALLFPFYHIVFHSTSKHVLSAPPRRGESPPSLSPSQLTLPLLPVPPLPHQLARPRFLRPSFSNRATHDSFHASSSAAGCDEGAGT